MRLPPEPETAKETIKRVALRARELEMMQQLGPIAGKSPRAAKRFVNVYRLVRGLRKGKALDRFLEEDHQSLQRPALYPAVLFWLAVHIGQSAGQIERLRAAVRLMSDNNQTGLGLSLPLRQTDPISGEYEVIEVDPRAEKALADWPYLLGFWCDVPPDDRPDMLRAFAAVEKSLPGSAGVKVLKEAMRETERFSFAYR